MLLLILCFVVAFPKPCVMDWTEPTEVIESLSDATTGWLRATSADDASETPPASSISLHSFPMEFLLFESQMKSVIENWKQDQLATIANMNRFIDEIDEYVDKLPSKNAYTVTTRDVCHCDGHIKRPCPSKCVYSCFHTVRGFWRYDEDCRGSYSQDPCKCNINMYGDCQKNLSICINQTKIQSGEDADKSLCSHYSIDKKGLVKSYQLIQSLLIEPLKIHFRCVESRLTFLRKASVSIDSLCKITDQTYREQQDSTYASQTQLLLATEKKKFRQMKRNITTELIKTLSQIESVARNVDMLKEEAFAKINRSIKEYSCCLRSLDFIVDDYDCSGIRTEPAGKPRLLTEFSSTSAKEDANVLSRIVAKYSNSTWQPMAGELSKLRTLIDLLNNKT